ncbi:MAG: ExbD/TolR family protein [Saprospiraceae bacterium]
MAEMAAAESGGRQRGSGVKKSKKKSTRVDMTPMVDLGFLLITFFVLVTTFNKPSAMDLNLPAKDDKEEKEDTPEIKQSKVVQFVLGPENKLYHFIGIENIQVDSIDFSVSKNVREVIAAREQEVARQWGSRDSVLLFIKPMYASKYRNMVDILDKVNIAGVKRFTLVDFSPADSLMMLAAISGQPQAGAGATQ